MEGAGAHKAGAGDEGLEELLARVRACRVCRDAPRFGPPLPHEPRPVVQAAPGARLAILSQAPGARVQASGRPFTDASGDRLRDWLQLDKERFYDPTHVAIVPMGFCFPGYDAKGSDLPPRRECAPLWLDDILQHLESLELVVLVGGYAQKWHLDPAQRKGGLTETVHRWREIYRPEALRRVIPLPHPSWRNTGWLKRNPWFEAELLPVLRSEVATLMGKG